LHAGELDQADKDLQDAMDELKALRDQAKKERADRDKKRPAGLTPPPRVDVALDQARKRTIEVSGTFSAAALYGLAAGKSRAERTATAAEATAKNTGKIADDLDHADGLAFE
jgi:hypothetical protein